MSHYNVRYDKTFLENERKAIQDVKEFLGEEYYERVVEVISIPEVSLKSLRIQLSMFAGLSGYPVGALFREFRPECNETGDYGETVWSCHYKEVPLEQVS